MFRFTILLYIVLFNSCYNYETQFDGAYDTNIEHENLVPTKSLIYTVNGDLVLSNDYGFYKEIYGENLDIEKASINNIHTKVLYKESNKPIVVFDLETWTIERTIAGSENAEFFDYHPNNESIYYFTPQGLLYVDGPPLYSVNPLNMKTNLSEGFSAAYRVASAVILPNNDIIACLARFNSTGYRYLSRFNEFEEIRYERIEETLEQMRINHSGTKMRAVGMPNWSYRDVTLDVDSLTYDYRGNVFSLPHSYQDENQGYRIDDDDRLYIPGGERFFVESDDVTSMDY